MAKDLTITLEDRPGILAELGEALGAAGVNIEGFCGYASEGTGTLHLLVDDAAAARGALEGAGFDVGDEREVLVVDIEDRPGALGVIARRIAGADASLDLAYLATNTRLVLGAEDLEAVRSAVG
ncbi:MAG TPA: ACT domain-containing protein [Gaiellaceae bacterium]